VCRLGCEPSRSTKVGIYRALSYCCVILGAIAFIDGGSQAASAGIIGRSDPGILCGFGGMRRNASFMDDVDLWQGLMATMPYEMFINRNAKIRRRGTFRIGSTKLRPTSCETDSRIRPNRSWRVGETSG